MDRKSFLKTTAAGSLSFVGIPDPRLPAEKKFSLEEMTISELQKKMASGTLSAVAITKLYLERIREIDKKGPSINAVIELNPDALQIAASLDNERRDGKLRGPMHGIPVLIKDNINTADKMQTTAGSLALSGNRPGSDAFIVQKLRSAGAVILGKTNLSEWANFRSDQSVSGWSSRGGQTRSPYILDRDPSGSSSGSGVAVAANLCTVAIGTETNGSVICPASVNGIAGMKPTVGLWSRSGIIPISITQDTAGPMARTVEDLAILLGALTGRDSEDERTSEARALSDYTKFLKKDGLKGKRIGVEKTHLAGPNEKVNQLFRQALEVLRISGAKLVETGVLQRIGNIKKSVLTYEFKDGLNRYLRRYNAPVKNLGEIIEFNKLNAASVMPYFGQETLIESQAKPGLDSEEYHDVLGKVLQSRQILSDLLAAEKLDAFCGVSMGPAGCIDLINGDYSTGYYFSTPAAISGFPHITVPMGQVFELPVGISFFSEAWSEPRLLEIAFAFEQASKKRKAPRFISSFQTDKPLRGNGI